MADDTYSTNVVAFPSGELKARGRRSRKTHAREMALACLDENICNSEKALLALAHSIKRQRALLEKLRPLIDITESVGAAGALFGDAVL